MQRTIRTDVVVVGARVAGASTAMLLARAGLNVIVVDRARAGSDTLSTHALTRGGVIQLHRWGVLDGVIAAGTPPIERSTFHLAAGDRAVDIVPSHGVDALYAPRRTVLDPLLAEAAEASGATVQFGFAAHQLLRNRGDRVVGVLGTDHTGRETAIHARFVVGADGLRSMVARDVDAAIERVGTGAGNYQYRYWADVETDGYHSAFRPTATAGAIPTNDGLTCVFVGSDARRVSSRSSGMFAELLTEASPVLAERVLAGRPVGTVRRFFGRPGVIRRPWGPGWVLVGDAGYWKDPITAHGITDALRDAELAATAIVRSLDAPHCIERSAMQAYHDTRNRLSQQLFDVTDRVASAAWADDEMPALLKSISAAMVDEVDHLGELDDIRELDDNAHARPAVLVGATAPPGDRHFISTTRRDNPMNTITILPTKRSRMMAAGATALVAVLASSAITQRSGESASKPQPPPTSESTSDYEELADLVNRGIIPHAALEPARMTDEEALRDLVNRGIVPRQALSD